MVRVSQHLLSQLLPSQHRMKLPNLKKLYQRAEPRGD